MCAGIQNSEAKPLALKSPDGNVSINFELKDAAHQRGVPFYNVSYKGKDVIAPSSLGLVLRDARPLTGDFSIARVSRQNRNTTWTPLCGERKSIPDRYREMTVELREKAAPQRRLHLAFRAYNEGIALRYILPRQSALEKFTIEAEHTQFQFPSGSMGYQEHGTEGEYARAPVPAIKADCQTPLTVEIPNSVFASVAEAHLENYSRMLLSPVAAQSTLAGNTPLFSDLMGPVEAQTPFASPWRVIVMGEKPGDLLERNYLVLNLNPPSVIPDTSWIKPGKVIREVTLSTSGGKACVDFAVARNLSYIELDAGWYGHEYDDASDATTVTVDPKRNPKGDLNLPEVLEYARRKNIGVLLYVNRRALEKQLDDILPLYHKWGVKGLKFGFVNVGPQQWTNWLQNAVRKAAQHQMVVDIHDAYRPTGLSRTYPNLLTQEGVRGNEHMPTAKHNVTLPFTRGVAGAADYTICYYTDRIKTTRAHQLALAAVMYSPLQFLYWYDKPAQYKGEPEIEFFDAVPTVWDDTKVLGGAVGEYVAVARQSGNHWFVGCLTDQKREMQLPLNFLQRKTRYVAHIYGDGDLSGNAPRNVQIRRLLVDSSSVLRVAMAQSGGQAIRLVPATQQDLQQLSNPIQESKNMNTTNRLKTEIIAHRGASHDAPENTLSAVRLAWEHNADAVEIDVYLSKDNKIVVMHDATTKRIGGVDRKIVEQTLEELRALDVGSWKDAKFAGEKIPTLDEVIATIPAGKRLVIEIKCGPEIVPFLKATLDASGRKPEQFLIIAFSQSTLEAAKKALPPIQAYWLSNLSLNAETGREQPPIEDLIETAKKIGADGLNLGSKGPWTAELVQRVKAAGLKCYVWTVNNADDARRLRDMGIDGITTDRAGWLREQLG